MGDKMAEAKQSVDVLKRKIADEAGKWELVTNPSPNPNPNPDRSLT